MIYEFIEILEHDFKSIIHFFRRMFCTYYTQRRCGMEGTSHGQKFYCLYWNCPKRKEVVKG